jgi:hypothetical protein
MHFIAFEMGVKSRARRDRENTITMMSNFDNNKAPAGVSVSAARSMTTSALCCSLRLVKKARHFHLHLNQVRCERHKRVLTSSRI